MFLEQHAGAEAVEDDPGAVLLVEAQDLEQHAGAGVGPRGIVGADETHHILFTGYRHDALLSISDSFNRQGSNRDRVSIGTGSHRGPIIRPTGASTPGSSAASQRGGRAQHDQVTVLGPDQLQPDRQSGRAQPGAHGGGRRAGHVEGVGELHPVVRHLAVDHAGPGGPERRRHARSRSA